MSVKVGFNTYSDSLEQPSEFRISSVLLRDDLEGVSSICMNHAPFPHDLGA